MDQREEFTWFFRAEYPALVRALYVFGGDRQLAEEAAQESLTSLYTHWRRVDSREAWVRKVAFRAILRTLRRDRRRVQLEADRPGAHDDVHADIDLLRSVQKLPTKQRVAVVLFYFEDRPTGEIADVLGCSPATVKVHLHRARKTLGIELTEERADVE